MNIIPAITSKKSTVTKVRTLITNVCEYFRPDEICSMAAKRNLTPLNELYTSPTALIKPAIKDFKPEIKYYEF